MKQKLFRCQLLKNILTSCHVYTEVCKIFLHDNPYFMWPAPRDETKVQLEPVHEFEGN